MDTIKSDDVELYNQFLHGNNDAFNWLIKKYHVSLVKFVLNYVKNIDDAEDLAQDTFVYILMNKKEYDFKYSFKTYLYTIAKSRALNYIKRKKKEVLIDDNIEIFDIDESVEQKLEIKENQDLILKAIHNLKEEYQRALYLYYFDDLKYKDISKILNISMSKTKTIIRRARIQLERELKEVK